MRVALHQSFNMVSYYRKLGGIGRAVSRMDPNKTNDITVYGE